MRIITGKLRGRRLKSPKNYDIRPTSDKVKEAVFNMLMNYLDYDFVCMDVFAGSGNMGIEAISRGAKTVYFSDSSRESLALVRENLKLCGVEDGFVLLSGDFKSNIARVRDKVDVFFLDPPYAKKYIPEALKAIKDASNLNAGGVIVCEHSSKDEMPDTYMGFTAINKRRYGAIGITMYVQGADAEEELN